MRDSFSPDNSGSLNGIDTVRFIAYDGFTFEQDPFTGSIDAVLYGPKGDRFKHKKLRDGFPVFEFSAYRWYAWPPGTLASHLFLQDLWRLCSTPEHAIHFLRIDFAAQLEMFATIDTLSYLRWYGRRSLQKKRKSWAFWPGQVKTVKFYDKIQDLVVKGNSVPDSIQKYPLRFELELRNPAISKYFPIDKGFYPNYDLILRDFHHLFDQIQPLDASCLDRQDYQILGRFYAGHLDLKTLNWKQKKSLKKLEGLGFFNED